MKNALTKTTTVIIGTALLLASFAIALATPALATSPTWDTSGEYVVSMQYLGTEYTHDIALTQDEDGNLSGSGGSPAGGQTYKWVINSGKVDGNTINFTGNYTATPDAVTPQTTVTVAGVIANDGTMSGTWSDNYAGGERTGTWSTKTGAATSTPNQDTDTSSSTVSVTIVKYVNGEMATASSSNSADFPMIAYWDAENTGAASGTYSLSETNTTPYLAKTTPMSKGADYATEEQLGGSLVGEECSQGKPYALQGYSHGNTMAKAVAATRSVNAPSFDNLKHDKYIVVWNEDCAMTDGDGQISGEVVGTDGELLVTSVDMIDTTATANGSFTDGWEYVFHVTTPMSEPNIAMKFNDWMRNGGGGTIPVGSNMRISSLQADNAGATVLLTAANTYSTPELTMVTDIDPATDGRQVKITVEVAIPNGTPNGAYTTSYGVRSNP
ncbi:hypothetical protein K2Q16_03990 [Patescibacteria group bacterium]|nr:hypothetical protein [Patescibacteria group bacterium]